LNKKWDMTKKKLGHKEAITRERKLQRRYDYVERGARC
jgi:hypothetical protein